MGGSGFDGGRRGRGVDVFCLFADDEAGEWMSFVFPRVDEAEEWVAFRGSMRRPRSMVGLLRKDDAGELVGFWWIDEAGEWVDFWWIDEAGEWVGF